ncbi:hypothetical protein, conserved [Plasmodium gonderi]|uniref:Uncharacterized protein n=1 Tax=Plasmodium gonderi TaxID=77519 RepID=A0A1Y1JCX0_PLAGO|nr:hypothetical protein, conserved [Plasmodium gonderi]GAW80371.1 hypothetical protein, conserved [Plasmodium gonderi]
MVKSVDLNISSYDTSNEYSGLFIGNIFSEIQDEIKNENDTQEFKNRNISAEFSNGKIYNSKATKAAKFFAPDRKINIEEYVSFVNDKKNEYKKKKKEYVIEYINKKKIKKFHYQDMEFLFKRYYQFLDFQEKCVLCNSYLSFPHLYLKKHLKKRYKGDEETEEQMSDKEVTYKYQHKSNNTTNCFYSPFCECLEKIEHSKQYLSDKKNGCYIDMIHFLKQNASSFSSNVKKNIIIKEFTKNVKFTEFYKYNSVNENYLSSFHVKSIDNADTKYINICRYLEKPQLTAEHVKSLNSHAHAFTPLFKIHKPSTLLTTVEKKLLIECLKVIKKIFVYDKIDKLTVIIFCYLSNLYNLVMRLHAECILSCYSKKHFEFFLYYLFQKNTVYTRQMKILVMKIYKIGNEHDDSNEDHHDF